MIKYGEEKRYGSMEDWADHCPDCGVKKGEEHELCCDIEECEICGRQLISCDCGEED